MAIAAIEHQKASVGYKSRTEAMGSEPPEWVETISVRHGGKILYYQRVGNALTTADGQTWGPASGLQAFIEHWGALPTIKREDAVDYTAEVRRAQEFRGSIDIQGFVRISRHIRPNLNCHFFCSGGQDRGGFYISTDFDSEGTNGVILTPYGSYWQFGPIALVADQSFATSRATLRDYPWALNCDETSPRMNVPAIRIEGFTHGIKADGPTRTQLNPAVTSYTNIGGSNFGLIEDGSFVEGFRLDRSKDFFRINSMRSWPFGATGTPRNAVWQDGTKIGLHLRGTDGFTCDSITAFQCKIVVDDQRWAPPGADMSGAAGSFIPHVFTSMELDGIEGCLEWKNGYGVIGNMTSQDRIFVSGGSLTIGPSKFHMFRNGAVFQVSGTAELHLSAPDFLLRRDECNCLRMTAGLAVIDNPTIRGRGASFDKTVDLFEQINGSLQIANPRCIGISSTPKRFVKITVDLASNNIECPPYYLMDLPSGTLTGRYISQSTTV